MAKKKGTPKKAVGTLRAAAKKKAASKKKPAKKIGSTAYRKAICRAMEYRAVGRTIEQEIQVLRTKFCDMAYKKALTRNMDSGIGTDLDQVNAHRNAARKASRKAGVKFDKDVELSLIHI